MILLSINSGSRTEVGIINSGPKTASNAILELLMMTLCSSVIKIFSHP
jgi:hypothetical protein